MAEPAGGLSGPAAPGLFVGREHEMATLRAALEGAISRQGELVIVAGEAGIGKSRMAEALAEEARRRDVRVAWGRSWEAGGAPPFWPWVQVLRALIRPLDSEQVERVFALTGPDVARIVPELRAIYGTPSTPTGDHTEASVRFELFDAVARSLWELSRDGPILVILDDLHAADEPSLLLLRFVCGDLADAPIMLLVTYREGELDDSDPRLAHLAELGRQPGATHLSPRVLSEQAVREYMERAVPSPIPAGLADLVHRQAEGNPLFMTEVVRLLVDEHRMERVNPHEAFRLEIPEGIRAVIGRRLTRLSPGSRQLLDRAAVIGVDVPLDQIMGLSMRPTGETLDLLDEAARADVLIAPIRARGPWRFKHALIREVLYSALPAGERQRLHLAVADVLEALHRDDPDPPYAVLAHHLVEAVPTADPGRTIDYSRRAAQQATEQAAHEEAMRLYRRALSIAPERDSTRVDLLIGLGEAAARAGDVSASRAAHLEAADLAEKLGLVESLALAAVGYGGRFGWLRAGSDRVLVPLLERALEALPDDDSRFRARLLARLSGALRSDRSMERRIRLSETGLSMARRLDDPGTLLFALISRYFAVAGPDVIDMLSALADETARVASQSRDREQICQAHLPVYDVLATTGGPHAELRAEIDAFGQVAETLRQPSIDWYHAALLAIFAINEGRLDSAERLIEESGRIGQRTLARDAAVSTHLATFAIRREQGRLAEIAVAIGHAATEFTDYPFFDCMDAFVKAQTGPPQEARRLLDRLAQDDFGFLPRDMSWLYGMTFLAEAALVTRDVERLTIIEELLRPFAGNFGLAISETSSGPVDRVLGLIASAAGRYDEALDRLESARRACAVSGLRTFELRTACEIARTLVLRGDPRDLERAAVEVEAVREEARSSGLIATEHEARQVLAALAGEPARSTDEIDTPPATQFVREGDAWRIGDGATFHLRHAKGLAYLATLLQTPGREHHALDLGLGWRRWGWRSA